MRFVMHLLITLIFFAAPAFAEYYRYTDENGNTHYTDDISKLPKKQRADLEEHQEYQRRTHYSPGSPELTEGEQASDTNDAVDKTNLVPVGSDEQTTDLFSRRQNLENEYQLLLKEKKQLEQERKKATTRSEKKDIDNRLAAQNYKIEKFNTKQSILNAEIERHNAGVKKETTRILEEYNASEDQSSARIDDIEATLNKKKQALNQEYQALMEEKERLDNEPQNGETMEKIKIFNEKASDYHTRNKQLNTEIEAYNNAVR